MLRAVATIIARFIRDERGQVTMWVAGAAAVMIFAGGNVIDYQRAAGLYTKLSEAADTGAREAAKGQSDDEVKGTVNRVLYDYMKAAGYNNPATQVQQTISRNANGTIELKVSAPFVRILGPVSVATSDSIVVAASAAARMLCTPPADQLQWTAQAEACPGNWIGTHTWEREEKRVGVCASPTSAPGLTPWSPTGNRRNEVNTCAPPCVAPGPETKWSASVEMACPAGQVGSIWIEKELQRTAYCPAATGSHTWNDWAETGVTREISNSCAPPPPPCVPPPPVERWVDAVNACTAPYSGPWYFQKKQVANYYCPAPTGNPVLQDWNDTGDIRNVNDQCVAPPWHAIWENPGTYQWEVPYGVWSIGIVAVGGGAAGQVMDMFSTGNFIGGPGGQSSVVGGPVYVTANGGGSGGEGGCGGAKHGGGCGGEGGFSHSVGFSTMGFTSGGGGAGGYGGNGGPGGVAVSDRQGGTWGSGGGGGGGQASFVPPTSVYAVGAGGGVGLYGWGGDGPPNGGGSGGEWGSPINGTATPSGPCVDDGMDQDGNPRQTCYWQYQPYAPQGGAYGGGGIGNAQVLGYIGAQSNPALASKAGGGGELSWANYAVTPGTVLTITVGAGGQPFIGGAAGAGGRGAVRIIWGADRWMPNHNVSGPNY